MTSLVALSGSLRDGSFNGALLRAAAGLVPPDVELRIASIRGIPLYDADVEAAEGVPAAVQALKDAIAAADGLLLATPEYNNAMPGVAKNAIDWLSRPPADIPRVFGGKPVGLIGASPGQTGTARGQSQLRQAFEFTNSYCMPQPELLVFRAHEKFDTEGRLTDAATAEYLQRYLAAFGDWVRRFV